MGERCVRLQAPHAGPAFAKRRHEDCAVAARGGFDLQRNDRLSTRMNSSDDGHAGPRSRSRITDEFARFVELAPRLSTR
jgi:hypothetical protein